LLKAATKAPLNFTDISKILIRSPYLVDTISDCFNKSETAIDTHPLRQYLQDLLQEAEVTEEVEVKAPYEAGKGKSDAKELKLKLPSCRQRTRGLRTGGLDTPMSDDPQVMARTAKEYWGKIWGDDKGVSPRRARDYCSNSKNTLDGGEVRELTVGDIVDCILDTNNSSAGPDGIPFRAYRSFATLIAPVFLGVFDDMKAGGLPPLGFNYAYLYLLPKRLTGLIEHTRPISVTNTDNRIIAKCLVFTIHPVVQARLHKAQKGSIANRQGADHIREITEQFYSAAETGDSKSNFFAFFIDTKKAFDSVRHNFIYAALRHIIGPSRMGSQCRASDATPGSSDTYLWYFHWRMDWHIQRR